MAVTVKVDTIKWARLCAKVAAEEAAGPDSLAIFESKFNCKARLSNSLSSGGTSEVDVTFQNEDDAILFVLKCL